MYLDVCREEVADLRTLLAERDSSVKKLQARLHDLEVGPAEDDEEEEKKKVTVASSASDKKQGAAAAHHKKHRHSHNHNLHRSRKHGKKPKVCFSLVSVLAFLNVV